MATYSSILPHRIPRTEEPGWDIVHGVAESDKTEQLNTHTHIVHGVAESDKTEQLNTHTHTHSFFISINLKTRLKSN